MIDIILEDTTSGVVNQNQAFLSADVSEREGASDISTNGLNLVRLAPVDVRTAGDTRGIEDVSGINGGQVGFEGGTILETAGAVGVGDGLSFAELSEKASNPAGTAIDEEIVGLGTVGLEHHFRREKREERLDLNLSLSVSDYKLLLLLLYIAT
jgi:hypothetical protein